MATDLAVWKPLIEKTINNYTINDQYTDKYYSSVFVTYDYNLKDDSGFLKVYRDKDIELTSKNLDDQKYKFFRWTINSSIQKIYNSIEILLQSVIYLEFINNDIENFGKKHIKKVNLKIKKYFKENNLGKYDTTNNRHIIRYLRVKSHEVDKFLNDNARTDLSTTWGNFFEFLSILRNVIAHNGMIIEKDTLNTINSIAKDIYNRYFESNGKEGSQILLSVKQNKDDIGNLIMMMNEFALNSVKFLRKEQNLKFCGFY